MNENLILTLIDKFNASSATELELHEGNLHLALRKEAASRGVSGAVTAAAPAQVPPANIPAPAQENDSGQVRLALPVSSSGNDTITSPIVAAFYSSPEPDAPPFVKPGAKVKAGDSLCILEAMKMMNRLEAEFDCEIVSVLAANGDLVEYGQALFEVKRL